MKKRKFLSHRFDSYAGMSFPDADVAHLETCIMFFLWAFSVSGSRSPKLRQIANCVRSLCTRVEQFDDLSDEGALQSKPDAVQIGVDISMDVLRNPEAPAPNFPYAAMLHECVFTRPLSAPRIPC